VPANQVEHDEHERERRNRTGDRDRERRHADSLLRDDVAAKQPDENREQHLDHVVDRTQRRDRRLAAAALAHRHGDLLQAEPMAEDHHGRLDLRVVVRVVVREERDPLSVQRLEPRRRVGHPLAHDA